jgi:hypothetical protein
MSEMFETDDQMRCAFAAFALQGIMANVDLEILESDANLRFIAESAFDIADMMMGVRNATKRH